MENVVYQPPKNIYHQYTRKDFDCLLYAETWSKMGNLLMEIDPQRAMEVLHGMQRTQ